MEKPTVSSEDLGTLLLCSMRYALGRRSYIVGYVASMIVEYLPLVSTSDVGIMTRELHDEINRAEENGKTLGDKQDHAVWWKLRDTLEVLKARKQ